MPSRSFNSLDELRSHLQTLTDRPGWTAPAAYAIGIARLSNAGDGSKVLDTYYPSVNVGENAGFLALVLEAAGAEVSTGTVVLSVEVIEQLVDELAVVLADDGPHPNARVLPALAAMATSSSGEPAAPSAGVRAVPVLTIIEDLAVPPVDAHDVYLRLHLISSRAIKPHGCNLDGQFGLLNNVVWTDRGPFDPETFEAERLAMRSRGEVVTVLSIDKFPQMADYVIPSGVRITVPSRVRLGAYLGDGTTLMHEGFVNFNAGTEGPAMIEGRISAGVFVGASSDIGGGASIMGTLSGGGKEVVSVGSGCLLGANSGLGISLGDNCVVEAGLYLTAGTVVTLPDGSRCKASQLSGRSDMLFRRNSVSGAVEMLAQVAEWGGLNDDLHSN